MPYKKAIVSEEAMQLMMLAQDLAEQPDFDFHEYGIET